MTALCDRCGAPLDPHDPTTLLSRSGPDAWRRPSIDLCPDCAAVLMAWLDGAGPDASDPADLGGIGPDGAEGARLIAEAQALNDRASERLAALAPRMEAMEALGSPTTLAEASAMIDTLRERADAANLQALAAVGMQAAHAHQLGCLLGTVSTLSRAVARLSRAVARPDLN